MKKVFVALLLTFSIVFQVNILRAQAFNDFQQVEKGQIDIILHQHLSDVCFMDIVRLAGPPKYVQPKESCEFLDSLKGNQVKFSAYVFISKKAKQGKKYPLLVLPHGGIHGTFGTSYIHILKEMLAQGYIVIAPDYRGSTGYGKWFYETIDYGGRENDDVAVARDYMVENYSIVDGDRVGIMGWSHGGMITLMNILRFPDKYAAAFAGVPVSDVAYRLTYQEADYLDDFTPSYHVGATPAEKPEEYARRSPITYAGQLQKPLLITTCLNDDDVSHTEVQRMIDALKSHNKDFEYKVYPKMPGAHSFDRIDTKEACEIRYKTWKFLEKYLDPPHKFKSYEQMRKAGFKYY